MVSNEAVAVHEAMTPLGRYKALVRQKEMADDEAKRLVRDVFDDEKRRLFEAFPDLQSFGWRQYTPYYNDGDPCHFNAWTTDPYINDSEESIGTYDFDQGTPPAGVSREMYDAVCAFLANFDDDAMLHLFGDHSVVRVGRNGTEVSSYDHD